MIALTIDGVLRQTYSGAPIPGGILLYRALSAVGNVGLIVDSQTEEQAKHFLLVNDLTDHNYLVVPRDNDPLDPGQRRVSQIIRLSASGAVDMLIESSPAIAATVIQQGTPTLLYCHPAYAVPDHLPGNRRIPTPWGSLVEEIERQREMKANDTRLNQETV